MGNRCGVDGAMCAHCAEIARLRNEIHDWKMNVEIARREQARLRGELALVRSTEDIDVQTIRNAMVQICAVYGITSPLHLVALAKDNEQTLADILVAEIQRQHDRLREELDYANTELGKRERWLREMCDDYKLEADSFALSQQMAINELIHNLREELEAAKKDRDTWTARAESFDWDRQEKDKEAREARAMLLRAMQWIAETHGTDAKDSIVLRTLTSDSKAMITQALAEREKQTK